MGEEVFGKRAAETGAGAFSEGGSSVWSPLRLGVAYLSHGRMCYSIADIQMANESSSALPPLKRSGVWKFKLLRIVLLGTADKGSILERLPKGDGVLDILLGPLVVYYELLAKDVDLAKGAEEGTLTQSQMELVTCFAPDRVHEVKDWMKYTLLHNAAMNGHSESVQLLLTANPNLNAEDTHKETPLHRAARYGQDEPVQLLLTAKANPNAANNKKNPPLHEAAGKGENESAQLLLTAKANPNAANTVKYTPLHGAAANGHNGALKLLLTAKANPNAATIFKATPLHEAAMNGQNRALQLLLTAKSNANAENKSYKTPLQLAQECGHSKCVELLSK